MTIQVTIRDYIKRRVRGDSAAFIAGAILLAAFMSLYHDQPERFPNSVLYVGGILVLGSGLVIRTTKCPRCRGDLGNNALGIGLFSGRSAANFCPHCGISFDEPYPR
jgi:hypothetical protein